MKKLVAILATGALALMLTAGTGHADSGSMPFMTTATGTDTLSPCGAACITATFNGTATSSHLGTSGWIANVTVDLTRGSFTTAGQFCAPAAGTATLPAANGDAVYLTYAGTVCVVNPASATSAHTFGGTYQIIGGTGRFADATGTGTITAGDDGAGNAYMSDTGTIDY